jgi:hypothetical protein
VELTIDVEDSCGDRRNVWPCRQDAVEAGDER